MNHLKKEDFNVCWGKDPFTVAESVIMSADNGLLPGQTGTTGLDVHPHAWIISIMYFLEFLMAPAWAFFILCVLIPPLLVL